MLKPGVLFARRPLLFTQPPSGGYKVSQLEITVGLASTAMIKGQVTALCFYLFRLSIRIRVGICVYRYRS